MFLKWNMTVTKLPLLCTTYKVTLHEFFPQYSSGYATLRLFFHSDAMFEKTSPPLPPLFWRIKADPLIPSG